jgi:integrase
VANKTINLEIGVLRGVLKRAKRWHLISDEIKPLKVRRKVGRVLSPEEKLKLQTTAAKDPDWENAYLAMTLSFNTTMRSCEVKGLQWRDVDFLERTITVRHSKSDAGERVIPLNDEAWQAIVTLYHRAQKVGGTEPKHYIFPSSQPARMVTLTRLPLKKAGGRRGER